MSGREDRYGPWRGSSGGGGGGGGRGGGYGEERPHYVDRGGGGGGGGHYSRGGGDRRRSPPGRSYDDRGRRDAYRDDHHRDGHRDDHYRRRSRSRSRSKSSGRDDGEPPRSKEEEELLELTRDARTVFVQQLVVRAEERDVREYFEQVGTVSDVRLIRDRSTGRSKGFAYVEFEDLEVVPKALLLNGQKFCTKHAACTCSGFPIAVKPAEAEKNYAAMAEAAGGSISGATLEKRIYLGNLSPGMTDGDLKALASLIGAPEKVFLIRDGKGNMRGTAYIQFSDPGLAQRALEVLHNQELGGKNIKVGRLNNMGQVVCKDGETFLLELGRGSALTAQARAALMAQLSTATSQAVQTLGTTLMAHAMANNEAAAASAGTAAPDGSEAAPATDTSAPQPAPDAPSAPTPCILLRNMFSPLADGETRDEHWVADLGDDVRDEAARYGKVLHLKVVEESAEGIVAVMFNDVSNAMAASAALSGRLFAGNHIAVSYIPLERYLELFPEAASAF